MKRVKRRIWSGAVLEQEIYTVSERTDVKPIDAKPRLRFRDEAQRMQHRSRQALREFTRWMNANFDDTCLYCTFTFDDEHEVEDFDEARRVRAAFKRRLCRLWPDAVLCIFMGRGDKTARIHMHACIKGVPTDEAELKRIIRERYGLDYDAEAAKRGWRSPACALLTLVWGKGRNARVEPMRRYNTLKNGVLVGRDYTGLAAYLWKHWENNPEQGGQHCLKTRNGVKCDREDASECRTSYSMERRPRVPEAPEGYEWIFADYEETDYGYQWFKWVLTPKRRPAGRPRKEA